MRNDPILKISLILFHNLLTRCGYYFVAIETKIAEKLVVVLLTVGLCIVHKMLVTVESFVAEGTSETLKATY